MAEKRLSQLAEVSYGRPVSRYERAEQGDQEPKRKRKNARQPEYAESLVLTVSALATWPDSTQELMQETREMDVSRPELFVQPNDIVVALSSPFPSACFTEEDLESYPIFVPNSCAIVRCSDVLDPWYLVGFLSLDVTRTKILPLQSRGGRAVLLSADQLGETIINFPPLEIQHALGELVKEKIKLESARRKADNYDRELINAVFARALSVEDHDA